MDIKTLDGLLRAGVTHGVSDLHFRPGAPPLFRLNGTMTPVKFDRLLPSNTEAIAGHFLAALGDRMDLKEIQEYDTSYSIPGVARFRVNIYRQRGSLAIVARLIPTEIPTVESLGLPAVLNRIAAEERGLVLVTGATGSGKSTTLAAMINLVNNTRPCHILTIEDPIEFLHQNRKATVSQREIGPDTKNYVVGLRAALRQDPDVILVGEMRDAESTDIALKAAETGHLVFSTVHTTDAAKTIGRIMSLFPADEQLFVRNRLADNLKATISQRLIPRVDGKGRVVAMEVMIVTQTVQEYVRDINRTEGLKDVIEKGRQQYGMQSFDQHLTDLYRAGAVTLQTAIHAATNPSDFERALNFE
ncbi:MAG TPA: type IV pilus twitching motility protein PilT [bacterium]